MHPNFVKLPRLLLPADTVDPIRWAVIACDQFTSEPSYWQSIAQFIGDAPSCLHLILPEASLVDHTSTQICSIHAAMEAYWRAGLLNRLPEGLMLVQRDTGREFPRRGVLLAFDLEAYEEGPGIGTPIRPTEATVVERVPARLEIRQKARFELPHILLFLDDPAHRVLEPLFSGNVAAQTCYDLELMNGGGHLTGRFMRQGTETEAFFSRLAAHAAPDACCARYQLEQDSPSFVFATGDGNHSMSAAKMHWEQVKCRLSPHEQKDHPARFVLAELVNLHDPSICFEAVHRLLSHVEPSDVLRFLEGYFAALGPARTIPISYRFGGAEGSIAVPCKPGGLPVVPVQKAIDAYLCARPKAEIDFIHSADSLRSLADAPDRLGFLLPDFDKAGLFPYIIKHGVLPRKTFSMGTAREKRYYFEGRMIRDD